MEAIKKRPARGMDVDLIHGPIFRNLLWFAVPIFISNLFQQLYNAADTMIVGNVLGDSALAAVGACGSIYELLVGFGLGIGNGLAIVTARAYGAEDAAKVKKTVAGSVVIGLAASAIITVVGLLFLYPLLEVLDTPPEIIDEAYSYIQPIAQYVVVMFAYNLCAALLRAVGNSLAPLLFLAVSAVTNIVLDLLFVVTFQRGVAGAAEATVISQYVSGLGLGAVALVRCPILRPRRGDGPVRWARVREIASFSLLTCVQQSVMNLGILMVQGLVNSFGPTIMAAFAAAVKIDSFAYLPVQDFGNAFSTFIAQNYGAGKRDRIRAGLRGAVLTATVFSLAVSALVWIFAPQLMALFVEAEETAIIREGVRYLRIEGAFYYGIGLLFLLYGLYRALERPGMSVALTVISLGARVTLAYLLSAVPAFGVAGIWWSVPIGWFLADLTGVLYYLKRKQRLLPDQISESSEKMVSSPR